MPGLIEGLAPQTPMDPTSPDQQSGHQMERFGPPAAGGWRFAKIVNAAEALPSSRLECFVDAQHPRIEWLVIPPAAGVTDFDVLAGRWVWGTVGPLVLDRFVPEIDLDTNPGTVPLLVSQVRERDPFALVIDGINGAGTTGPAGVTRPNNPAPIPVTSFVVLWRPATLNPGS